MLGNYIAGDYNFDVWQCKKSFVKLHFYYLQKNEKRYQPILPALSNQLKP